MIDDVIILSSVNTLSTVEHKMWISSYRQHTVGAHVLASWLSRWIHRAKVTFHMLSSILEISPFSGGTSVLLCARDKLQPIYCVTGWQIREEASPGRHHKLDHHYTRGRASADAQQHSGDKAEHARLPGRKQYLTVNQSKHCIITPTWYLKSPDLTNLKDLRNFHSFIF